jgi:hypothetical protein
MGKRGESGSLLGSRRPYKRLLASKYASPYPLAPWETNRASSSTGEDMNPRLHHRERWLSNYLLDAKNTGKPRFRVTAHVYYEEYTILRKRGF